MRPNRKSWIGWGAFGTYCLSWAGMLATSVVALGVLFGMGTMRMAGTPLDPVLRYAAIPLLILSTAVLAWTTLRGPRISPALVVAGGVLALAGMVLVPSMQGADGSGGMAGMGSPATNSDWNGEAWRSFGLFWAGTLSMIAGVVWRWRPLRASQGAPNVQSDFDGPPASGFSGSEPAPKFKA